MAVESVDSEWEYEYDDQETEVCLGYANTDALQATSVRTS